MSTTSLSISATFQPKQLVISDLRKTQCLGVISAKKTVVRDDDENANENVLWVISDFPDTVRPESLRFSQTQNQNLTNVKSVDTRAVGLLAPGGPWDSIEEVENILPIVQKCTARAQSKPTFILESGRQIQFGGVPYTFVEHKPSERVIVCQGNGLSLDDEECSAMCSGFIWLPSLTMVLDAESDACDRDLHVRKCKLDFNVGVVLSTSAKNTFGPVQVIVTSSSSNQNRHYDHGLVAAAESASMGTFSVPTTTETGQFVYPVPGQVLFEPNIQTTHKLVHYNDVDAGQYLSFSLDGGTNSPNLSNNVTFELPKDYAAGIPGGSIDVYDRNTGMYLCSTRTASRIPGQLVKLTLGTNQTTRVEIQDYKKSDVEINELPMTVIDGKFTLHNGGKYPVFVHATHRIVGDRPKFDVKGEGVTFEFTKGRFKIFVPVPAGQSKMVTWIGYYERVCHKVVNECSLGMYDCAY